MPPPASKNLAAFKQLALRAVDTTPSQDQDERSSQSSSMHHGVHSNNSSKRTLSIKNVHSHPLRGRKHSSHEAGGSGSSNLGSQDDISSGENSETDFHREKRKGLAFQKTENIITKIRDLIAQSDVFIVRRENPPFLACIQVSVWFIPIFFIWLLWDTLAVTAFEIPHLSWVNHPGFLLGWHFVMVCLAMYGFMLSYLSSGSSSRTSLAAISLGIHYLLLVYRIFMEVYFDGFRSQNKLWIEKPSHAD